MIICLQECFANSAKGKFIMTIQFFLRRGFILSLIQGIFFYNTSFWIIKRLGVKKSGKCAQNINS